MTELMTVDDLVYLDHHLVYLSTDQDEWQPQIRCLYVPESTRCGLFVENMRHDPDACAAYDEGDDGCEKDGIRPGWVPAPGCAVKEVASQYGLAVEDLFDYDTSKLPRGIWFPVRVAWDDTHIEESVPVLVPLEKQGREE